MKSWLGVGFVFVCFSALLLTPAHAATVNAATCAQADVAKAVSAAQDGDTISVPACGATTWTTYVTLDGTKSLTVQGAGSTSTYLTKSTASALFYVSCTSTAKTIRITGFNINDTGGGGNGWILINCPGATGRIDSNTYAGGGLFTRVLSYPAYFVIDHNTWMGQPGIKIEGYAAGENGLTGGNKSWADPPTMGTNNAVYIEDNTIIFTTQITDKDCTFGARVVWRYNTFNNNTGLPYYGGNSETGPKNHGYDSTNSCRDQIIYNNTITGGGLQCFMWRGGSGLAYNNVCSSGTYGTPIGLTNYRSTVCAYPPYNGLTSPQNAFNPAGGSSNTPCDGTSSVDGNTSGSFGWPCYQQIGRGQNQTSEPIYIWNNCKLAGCKTGDANWFGAKAFDMDYGKYLPTYTVNYHILANRDFYNDVASFNGTVGIGQGLLSARPATCTAGVAYWDTNANVLYQCKSTNSWVTYYTPFTYPHPLVGPPPVQPPTGLTVKVS